MKSKKADVTFEEIIKLLIILIPLAVILIFLIIKYVPGVSEYFSNYVAGPLGGR